MANTKILVGNALDVLRTLPSESVDCCVTSPPYWGLRDYKTEPIIWDGDEDCEHEWGDAIVRPPQTGGTKSSTLGEASGGHAISPEKVIESIERQMVKEPSASAFCQKCGAWRGQLGLEPTPQLYVQHLVAIFDEVKRVLKKTGTCWVNLGDTYSATRSYQVDGTKQVKGSQASKGMNANGIGIPEKSLVQIPSRFAIAMTDAGWILRNEIVWCLDGETKILARIDGQINHLTIEEMGNFIPKNKVEVPTQDIKGDVIWVSVINHFNNGEKNTLKIVTKSGRAIYCTPEHQLVAKTTNRVPSDFLKLNLRSASDLKVGDSLIVNDELNLSIPVGDEDDFIDGFTVGFFMAEGNYICNKVGEYTDSKFSVCAQKRWGRSVPDNRKTGIQLSCGERDIVRGFLPLIETKYNIRTYEYENSRAVRSSDKALVELIDRYVSGKNCHEYHLKPDSFNRTRMFMGGILHGFLCGDGHFDVANNRWRIGTCPNKWLYDDIALLCRLTGASCRFEGLSKSTGFGGNFDKQVFSIRFDDGKYRKTFNGNILDPIESIEQVGKRQVYDIEIEPLYTTFCGKGTTTTPTKQRKLAKYNNLYFLANGIWTHNCKPNAMPSSVKDRFTVDFEKLFFFTKSKKYYFEQQFEPLANASIGRAKRKEKLIERTGMGTLGKQVAGGVDNEHAYAGLALGRNGKTGYNLEKGRNMRCVWNISTRPYKGSHFATFSPELPERCIKAGSSEFGCCAVCGKPYERKIERKSNYTVRGEAHVPNADMTKVSSTGWSNPTFIDNGWGPTCKCGSDEIIRSVVLDPFGGSGTTAMVANGIGRDAIVIELNPDYVPLIEKRLKENIQVLV